MVARPEVGAARPSSSRMVVDFPARFGQRNRVMRPGASSKDRSLTAVTVPYRLVSAWTAMVLMAVPPEVVVTVPWWTPSTLGGAAARGAGRQDALSRTAAAYGIHRGMYAEGGFRSAAGGDQPGLVGGDDQLGPVPQAELGQDPADMGLGGRRAHHQPAGDLGVGQSLRDQYEHLAFPPGELARQPRVRPAHGRPGYEVGHQVTGGRRGEQRLPGGHDPDRREQLFRRRVLEQEAACHRSQRREHVL